MIGSEKKVGESSLRSMPGTRHAILLTGGGTGGHLAIVRAVKEALLAQGVRPFYIGSESGQDREWFDADGDFADKLFLPTRGVVNRRGFGKAAALGQVLKSSVAARRYLKEHGISAVLSVGGFSAAPASFAALASGVPLFIHEQNAVPGRLNRLFRPFCRAYFSSYDGERIDYPVREVFFQKARTRATIRTVVFLGGSQGASAINDFALKAASGLKDRGIAIIHQTGRRDFERVKQGYARVGIDADVFPFDKALHEKIARADFAVSRAGASTLWELVANRIPTLFVPYPHAAGDHQYFNAKFLCEKGAAWVKRESELVVDDLLNIDAEAVEAASRRLEGLIGPGGAEAIANALLQGVL
ncbi:UDP-N-acetylglucosamine--N-acetylmuramyl-(pentapeptide) pyrophosphoryl-undecaprenol N-acetylglucosamine transferase [Hydrogenimonas urashimensis]|uniref:UDP-N-acetylglucosamine--N-acetylmuramyl- (pentapeptide) pyrophosphoryl-undecaprenol N-acetylglucosamine transferase n=1 Tax=Hydrogenimonas urashimensis TaxID=2740515 RepID=UPI001F4031E5|nr:UDP-N-acetylglucosamine--N-acetylmuramyl-(pentapeptide) pyrophosphoryl-undecaprenol N-acetylglucosamine transferase [Hydrogenimonas urashimensis]